MSSQSRRFAAQILELFAQAGRLTDDEVAEAGGPSDTYMTGVRKAAKGLVELPKPRRNTQRAIAAAANIDVDDVLKLWNMHAPLPAPKVDRLHAIAHATADMVVIAARSEAANMTDPAEAERIVRDAERVADEVTKQFERIRPSQIDDLLSAAPDITENIAALDADSSDQEAGAPEE